MNRLSSERHDFSQQEPSGEFLERQLKRRSVLKLGGLVLGGGMLADTVAGEFIWGGTNPEIHIMHDAQKAKSAPYTYTLAIGGFNVFNMEGLGATIADVLPAQGQIAFLKQADNGINLADIEREVDRFIEENDVLRLSIYGHSMGGMLALQIAAMIKDKVPYMEAVYLDCTPASHYDLRDNKQTGTWLLHKADEAELYLGPVTRMGIEAVAPLIDGHDDIMTICKNAITKVTSGQLCSNQLLEAQASVIRTFNAADYRGSYQDDMYIFRLRPQEYAADSTINNQTSLPTFRSGLERRVIDVPVMGSGHADPGTHTKAYRDAVTPVLERSGLYKRPGPIRPM